MTLGEKFPDENRLLGEQKSRFDVDTYFQLWNSYFYLSVARNRIVDANQ